jgi:hypothetical protein
VYVSSQYLSEKNGANQSNSSDSVAAHEIFALELRMLVILQVATS